MNADGSHPVNLTGSLGPTDEHSPAWSPTIGEVRLAFARGSAWSHSQIVTMRPDGADLREVTAAGAWLDDHPAWSPDGTRIAFTRELPIAPGSSDLRVVDAGGGNESPLLSLPGAPVHPSWSPDGRLVAFASDHEALGDPPSSACTAPTRSGPTGPSWHGAPTCRASA